MYVVRRQLKGSEGAPPDTRVNPETGEVETSPDGGVTWNPNPGADPRLNPAYQLPPNTSPDARCAAAAGMVENVRRVFETAATGTSVAGIATALIGLLLIPGVGWMFYVFLIAAGSIVFLGAIAVRDAFTEEVYEWLLCAFFTELDADGFITQEGLNNVVADSAGQGFSSLVPSGMQIIVDMHKVVGFNNAGVVYADPEADCPCATWCYTVDLTLGDGGFTFTDSGSWSSGVGLVATDVFILVPRTLLMGEFIFPGEVQVQSIDMIYDYLPVTTTPGTEGTGIWSNYFENPMWSFDQNVAPQGVDLHANVLASNIPETLEGISVYFQSAFNANGGTAVIKTVQLTGTGEPPSWFEDNGWEPC